MGGEQLFPGAGVCSGAQQQVFKAFGVHLADIDRFNQPAALGDVVRSQPRGQCQVPAMAQAERAFGAPEQILQGQIGQAHGGGFDSADGIRQAGGREEGQFNVFGVKVVLALINRGSLLKVALVAAHLLVQHVGGIGVDVADAVEVGLAPGDFFSRGQGQAVLAVAGLVGGTGVAQPVGQVPVDGFKAVQAGLRPAGQELRGVGDGAVDLLQSRPADAGRQLERTDVFQLAVEDGRGAGVEHIALKLVVGDADFPDGIGPADLPGPGPAQGVQRLVGEDAAVGFAQQYLRPGGQHDP